MSTPEALILKGFMVCRNPDVDFLGSSLAAPSALLYYFVLFLLPSCKLVWLLEWQISTPHRETIILVDGLYMKPKMTQGQAF